MICENSKRSGPLSFGVGSGYADRIFIAESTALGQMTGIGKGFGCRPEQERSTGELDRLVASLVLHCDRAIILSDMAAGRIACTRIGGPLLFGRLWERLGIAEALGELLADRGFEFAVERAVFASVLHRLFVSGSDRSCDKWVADYRIEGIDGLELHHLYRAMAWLGEEIVPAAAHALAAR
jgi:hypothetical protein